MDSHIAPGVTFNTLYASSTVIAGKSSGKVAAVEAGVTFVDAEVLNTKQKLAYWVKLALEYNAIAKASKKKKK